MYRIPDSLAPISNETDSRTGLPSKVLSAPDGAKMVLVPPGEFLSGLDLSQLTESHGKTPVDDESFRQSPEMARFIIKCCAPSRRVYLDAFYIDIHPVTNAQYSIFLTAKPQYRVPAPHEQDESKRVLERFISWDSTTRQYTSGKEDYPVVFVDWFDASAYAEWVGKALPTESEWEKAARGTDGRVWPWGNSWDATRCNSFESAQGGLTPVTKYPLGRSPYGCYDMAGNTNEWCQNVLDDRRIAKSGSLFLMSHFQVCAMRTMLPPTEKYPHLGFRCVYRVA